LLAVLAVLAVWLWGIVHVSVWCVCVCVTSMVESIDEGEVHTKITVLENEYELNGKRV
jgi:hypothetical protein